MKSIFLFLTMTIALASCNQTKLVTNSINEFLKKHDYQQSAVYNPVTKSTKFTASISGLYDTTKLKELCENADITFKVVAGKIEVSGECPGAEQQIKDIFGQLFGKIVFK